LIDTSQKFGIISDILGDREDVPTVKMSNVFMPESENVFLQYGMLRAMPGRADSFLDSNGDKTVTPDENTIIHYHRHVSAAGIEYVFAFTSDHVYRWDQTNKVYTTLFTCGSSCTLWCSGSIDQKVVITNGVDKVQYWDETTPGSSFAPLDSSSGLDLDGGTTYLTAAKYLIAHENYLFFGYTTEGGTSYPFRIRWCSLGDITDYDETGDGDTGAKDFKKGSDAIKGFGTYTYGGANILVAFKEESIYAVWLTEGPSVWNTSHAEGHIGLLATHSVVNDKDGHLYYIASDYTIRKFGVGIISQFKDPTIRGINSDYQDYIESAFIDTFNQIWWSIPSSAASTGNDKIVAYNLNYMIWHNYTFAICAFGKFSSQTSYTIDGLDDLASTIDGLDEALEYIDYVEAISGFPLDLGSDYSGYTYALHNSEDDMGSSLSRKGVLSTDLSDKRSLIDFKRISLIRVLLKGQQTENTVALSIKRDSEDNWQSLGTISLNSTSDIITEDLSADHRARHFLLKIEASNRFDFIGVFFDFEWDNDR